MKRIALLILSIVLCAFLAASCEKGGASDPGTKPGGNTRPPVPTATEPAVDNLSDWDGPVVTVAFPWDGGDLKDKIREFEESGEVRVKRMDYSALNSDFDPSAGEERLALDLVTGKIAPDLVLIPSAAGRLADAVREKNLWADLAPRIETDGFLNREDLFASVLASFSTADGKIWALSNGFTANTLIGNDALLGDYAGREGWTLEELLDFADSIPPDVVLVSHLCHEQAADILLGSDGYAQFIDREAGTCSFDSPLFLRWLKFLAPLPKDWNELTVKSPLESKPREERYELYYTGKVALENRIYFKVNQMVEDAAVFGTDAFTRIGYPDAAQSRMKLDFDWTYAILNTAENPDGAWDFMKTFFEPDRMGDPPRLMVHEIPVLKSIFEEMTAQYKDTIFIQYFSGGGGGMAKGHPDNPQSDAELDQPGHMYEFTEEDGERIFALLDSEQVTRIADRTPSEVRAIVDEEISAFLGGASTAEGCAAAIQSRVTIWLAEHK
ncbi:MAG: hypothetical protein II680_00290 [Clostridia bacterium]|nr:hypothetical protein [Clostridia bacterium]